MAYTEYDTLSREELQEELKRLKILKNEKVNEELAIKDVINSMYGATANSWFSLYDINISESITLQGQDVWRHAVAITNNYFLNMWHLDTELHKQMGITTAKQLYLEPVVYGDTDSNYIVFKEMIESCDYKGDGKDFIIEFNKLRYAKYLEDEFIKYSEEKKTKSYLNFELESISYSAIFVAKKKYAYDLAWKDPGISYSEQSKVVYKGLDIIQSSYPKFAREKLNELSKKIFSEKSKLNIRNFVARLKELKEEFKLQDVENIAMSIRVNNYEKYILNDTTRFEVGPKCQPPLRAAGFYNYTLNNSKFKTKYPLIKGGDKVKIYFSDDMSSEVFGFLPNQFPYEIAPPIDYDAQFSKVIIDPINRLLDAAVNVNVPGNLAISKKLF